MVRFALIGTGNIADFHARAIELVPNAHLAAVWGRGRAAGESLARRHGCDFSDDLDSVLARADIDAVAVTTPSGTHAAIGIAAARAGKHVLCEKPLDIDLARIDELVRVCAECGVTLGAVFQSRFGPGARAARAAVAAGRCGTLTQCGAYIPWFRAEAYYAGSSWRGTRALDGGGALMNQGVHALDLLLWLAGDVRRVSGRVQTRLRPIEVEDNAVAWLEFANGALGLVQASTVCYPGQSKRVEIKGDRGSITLLDDIPVLWEFDDARPEDDAIRAGQGERPGGGAGDPTAISVEGHRLQYLDFVEAVASGREPGIPGREGRRAVALIAAIYESSARGCPLDVGGAAAR